MSTKNKVYDATRSTKFSDDLHIFPDDRLETKNSSVRAEALQVLSCLDRIIILWHGLLATARLLVIQSSGQHGELEQVEQDYNTVLQAGTKVDAKSGKFAVFAGRSAATCAVHTNSFSPGPDASPRVNDCHIASSSSQHCRAEAFGLIGYPHSDRSGSRRTSLRTDAVIACTNFIAHHRPESTASTIPG